MSIFVTFSVAAALIFLIAVAMRPGGKTVDAGVQLSEAFQRWLATWIPDPEFRWLLTVFAATFVIVATSWGLFWQEFRDPVGPDASYSDFLTSRAVASAVFGVVFGLFFSYWLRTVLFREAKDGASYKEIVLAVLMLVFLMLGVGGQSTLANLIERISSFELPGGTKLDFTEAKTKDVSGTVTTAVKNPSTTKFAAPDESQGLNLLGAMANTMNQDADYAEIISQHRPAWERQAVDFASDNVVIPALCLARYVDDTGDSNRVGNLLTDIGAQLGTVIRSDDVGMQQFTRDSVQVSVDDVGRFFKGVPSKMLTAPPPSDKPDCRQLIPTAAKMKDSLDVWTQTNTWRERPYMWLAAADMFAYGHHYVPALALLDEWVRALTGAPSDDGSVHLAKVDDGLRQVYEIRVRNSAVVFVEEWIRYSPTSKTIAVLDYHLSNLSRLIEVLERIPAVSAALHKIQDNTLKLADNHFRTAPNDDGACPLLRPDYVYKHANDVETRADNRDKGIIRLVEALLSMKTLWITTALDDPEFVSKYSKRATEYIDGMLMLDLSCTRHLSPGADDPNQGAAIDRSEMLNLFARIELADSADVRYRTISDPDRIRATLRDAGQAVRLGVEIVKPYRDASTKNAEKQDFLNRIAGDGSVSSYEDLVTTREQLERATAQ